MCTSGKQWQEVTWKITPKSSSRLPWIQRSLLQFFSLKTQKEHHQTVFWYLTVDKKEMTFRPEPLTSLLLVASGLYHCLDWSTEKWDYMPLFEGWLCSCKGPNRGRDSSVPFFIPFPKHHTRKHPQAKVRESTQSSASTESLCQLAGSCWCTQRLEQEARCFPSSLFAILSFHQDVYWIRKLSIQLGWIANEFLGSTSICSAALWLET